MRSSNRILIADDHPLTREGLSLAARTAIPGTTTHGVGTIAEGAALLDQWHGCRMILLDFMMPDSHGFTGLLTLQHIAPSTPIVVVTAREESALTDAARALGAAAYIYKSRPLDEIAGNLRDIDSGATIFPAGAAPDRSIAGARDRIADLSPAQHAVLMALADGRSNKQIAYDLDVTEATIKAHLTAIFRKLGVTNRAQAMIAVQPLFQAGVAKARP
ncbi:LuxR C-terminal-related transcriptional regulator [Sphingomonas sp. RS2018]